MKAEDLLREKENLEFLLSRIDEQLAQMPPGRLRISTSRKKEQFFHQPKDDEDTRIYIRKKDRALAEQLAQKTYLEHLKTAARGNHEFLDAFLKNYSATALTDAFTEMCPARQKLVTPWIETDAQYAARWLNTPFVGKDSSDVKNDLYSEKNEHMRSKSELLIANTFIRKGIPYKYECPLRLKDGTTIYPDFTVLQIATRKVVYVEHCGIMDNPDYRDRFFWKQKQYVKNGILPGRDLIMTFEDDSHPLDTLLVNSLADYLAGK